MRGEKLHRRILDLRTHVAVVLVFAATAHHLGMKFVPIELHLVSEIFVYGILVPGAAWLLLGWVASSVADAEAANQDQAETAVMLARRNRQMEAIYTTNRLLAGARDVHSVAGPLAQLAGEVADADGAALLLFPDGPGAASVTVWSSDGQISDDLGLNAFVDAASAPCLTCTASSRCRPRDNIRCIKLGHGQETVGVLRLVSPVWSSGTDSSLNTFVGEIASAWQARRAERRAIEAFQRIGRGALGRDDRHKPASQRILEEVVDALGANAATFFRLEDGRLHVDGVCGTGAVPTPRSIPEASDGAVWVENSSRHVYTLTGNGHVIGLAFPAARQLSVQTKQMIGVTAALVEFTRRASDRFCDLVWEERRRVSGELHDSIAQTIAYLNLRMHQAIDQLRDGRVEHASTEFDAISAALLDAYEEIRMAVEDLRLYPGDGEQAGKFLRRVATTFATREGISISVNMPNDIEVPPEILAQVTRVFQEALNNAVSHSDASRIALDVDCRDGELRFSIADNGQGFDPGSIPPRSHYGCAVMRERVEELGGTFRLDSRPGQGTSILVRVPLPDHTMLVPAAIAEGIAS